MKLDVDAVESYSIEGYSTNAPLELQVYGKYWGGFDSPDAAERYAANYKDTPHKFRIVKVTREVIKEIS